MIVEVTKSFEKDIQSITDATTLGRLSEVIAEIEDSNTLRDIASLKKMTGVGPYYRARVGDYRLGVRFDGGAVTLIRFLHRKDIYRYFP